MGDQTGRILLVTSNFPPVTGGSSSVYVNLASRGHDAVSVLTAWTDYRDDLPLIGWREFDLTAKIDIRRLSLVRAPILAEPNFQRRIAARFKEVFIRMRVLKEIARSVIRQHVRVICIGELVACGWIARAIRPIPYLRTVIYIHGEELTTTDPSDPKKSRLQTLLEAADRIIVVSDFTRRAVSQISSRAHAKTTLISNGVDRDRFVAGPKNDALLEGYGLRGCFVFLSVCRLVEKKGLDAALKAFALVNRKFGNTRFLIVGSGPYKPQLDSVIESERLQNVVVFAGPVPEEDLVEHYRLGDVFVMPNRALPNGDTEGFGLVFLEANSCGLPVIAGRDGGSVEAVQHGANGLVVNGQSVDDIAAAMTSLLTDDELRLRLTATGEKFAAGSDWSEKARSFVAAAFAFGDPPMAPFN